MKFKTLILGLMTILGLCSALLAQRTRNPQTNAINMLMSGSLSGHSLTISAALPPATTGVSYNATFTASGGRRLTVSRLPRGCQRAWSSAEPEPSLERPARPELSALQFRLRICTRTRDLNPSRLRSESSERSGHRFAGTATVALPEARNSMLWSPTHRMWL